MSSKHKLIKIRPLRYGNTSKAPYFKTPNELKSDRCGMETWIVYNPVHKL